MPNMSPTDAANKDAAWCPFASVSFREVWPGVVVVQRPALSVRRHSRTRRAGGGQYRYPFGLNQAHKEASVGET